MGFVSCVQPLMTHELLPRMALGTEAAHFEPELPCFQIQGKHTKRESGLGEHFSRTTFPDRWAAAVTNWPAAKFLWGE